MNNSSRVPLVLLNRSSRLPLAKVTSLIFKLSLMQILKLLRIVLI